MVVLAPEMVDAVMVRFPPLPISSSLKSRLESPVSPLIVRDEVPGPVIVSAPTEAAEPIVGSAELRVMVPVTQLLEVVQKDIVSAELSERFESVIACRSDPKPESFVLVT